ncbi:hypothetical protein M8542_10220 [Amycolatopsis sp. OK19-0408]|uniref:STAS domain-containing protein n=1 Tax=Amycolatopsis iheyensis TaxID=2945988 RepID=A0A9X2N8D8_9PSEU|nr:hypothetical protein [Amycolatopsis iheyensis]MCR6483192.1 hypothetical protein [Amycolatopsis iheyensis]
MDPRFGEPERSRLTVSSSCGDPLVLDLAGLTFLSARALRAAGASAVLDGYADRGAAVRASDRETFLELAYGSWNGERR